MTEDNGKEIPVRTHPLRHPILARPPGFARDATPDDLAEIARLDRLVFPGYPYTHAILRQWHDVFPRLLLVWEQPNAIVAYALGAFRDDDKTGWVLSAGTHPDHQRRGVATSLIASLIERLECRGARGIRLTVEPDAIGAIALYERLGFRKRCTTHDYYGPDDDAILMERPATSNQIAAL